MISNQLLNADLYERVLVLPAEDADTLHIVSGYATPAMLARLMNDLPEDTRIHLVVGMVGHEGLPVHDHLGFLALLDEHPSRLRVAYTTGGHSVHSKLYVWLEQGVPRLAFAGSSNFTQNGFLVGWRRSLHSEILGEVDPSNAEKEFMRIEGQSIDAQHQDVYSEIEIHTRSRASDISAAVNDEVDFGDDLLGADSVVLPLIARNSVVRTNTTRGHPHSKWGLNWGVDRGRSNPNEAVIPIPKQVWKDNPDFFPNDRPHHHPVFHVTTDDNKSLMLVVAEANNKALHSLPSNGALGEYFRYRLGVANGEKVTLEHLQDFGTRFVKFYRLDDESYHMVFSPDVDAEGAQIYGLEPLS